METEGISMHKFRAARRSLARQRREDTLNAYKVQNSMLWQEVLAWRNWWALEGENAKKKEADAEYVTKIEKHDGGSGDKGKFGPGQPGDLKSTGRHEALLQPDPEHHEEGHDADDKKIEVKKAKKKANKKLAKLRRKLAAVDSPDMSAAATTTGCLVAGVVEPAIGAGLRLLQQRNAEMTAMMGMVAQLHTGMMTGQQQQQQVQQDQKQQLEDRLHQQEARLHQQDQKLDAVLAAVGIR